MGIILAMIFVIGILAFLTTAGIVNVSANPDNAYEAGKSIFENLKETVQVWLN